MRTFLLICLMAIAPCVVAQASFSLQPASARAGEEVQFRLDSQSGCYPVPLIEVDRVANLRVNVHVTDTAPCLPEWNTPRFASLGTFAPGIHSIDVFLCGNSPPPEPECEYQRTLELLVAGADGVHRPIPALGWVGGAIAAVMMLLAISVTSAAPIFRDGSEN